MPLYSLSWYYALDLFVLWQEQPITILYVLIFSSLYIVPDVIDFQFGECEGYPGVRSPDIKDYIVKHQVTATHFYSAYPNASVRDVWKALKIKGGIDVVLDEATS